MTHDSRPPQPLETPLLERIARLVVVALCLDVLAANLGPLKEGDEFMHLAIGRWMLEHHALLPTPDPLVWNDRSGDMQHEWLAQALFAALAQVGGLAAIRLLRGVLIAGTAALLAHLFRRVSGHWTTALTGVALWWLVAQPHAAARPHLLGWLLSVIVLGYVLPTRRPWKTARWLTFSALLVFWAQVHSSVVIVPLYLGLHTAGLALAQRRLDRVWVARTALAGALTLLQPCGWHLFAYVRESPRVLQGLADEWSPLLAADVWHSQPAVLVAAGAVALTTLWLTLRQRGNLVAQFPNALPGLFALWHAADTRRMTFYLWVPLLTAARDLQAPRRPLARLVIALVPALACFALLSPRGVIWTQQDYLSSRFPALATVFLDAVKPQGRLFNPDPWGGWLEWQLHGRVQVAADGRMLMPLRAGMEETLRIQAHAADTEALAESLHLSVLMQRQADWFMTRPLDPQQFLLAWNDGQTVVVLRRDAHLAANVASMCDFYQKNPPAQRFARWQQQLARADGGPTPTSVPSVLDACAVR